MKVLMVNKFFRRMGGAETYMFNLIDLLDQNRHEVIPFSMKHCCNESSRYSHHFLAEVDYHRPRSVMTKIGEAGRLLYSLEARRQLRKLIKEATPTVAHCHNIYHQISPSILHELKEQGIPIVLTAHDYKLLCGNYKMLSAGVICERCCGGQHYHAALQRCVKGSLTASVLTAIEMQFHRAMRIYDTVDLIITPSLFLKNKLLEYGHSSDKVCHIPNFVDAGRFDPCYENQGYLLYLGRLVEEKGLKTLLKAMTLVKKARLVLLGDGPQGPELKRWVEENNLTNVTFAGFLNGKELQEVIRGAIFTVLPSECYENNPLSVLEAFATGKPVVGSRIGGIPELIDDGVDGVLFQPGNAEELADKVGAMLAKPANLAQMGRAAREKAVREYNPRLHYDRIMEVYERLVPVRVS